MRRGFALMLALISVAFLASGAVHAQAPAGQPSSDQSGSPKGLLEPVLPVENENIVFVEGEDAVSTDFDSQAVLNYSCSRSRALQLNNGTGLAGVGSFYADYVFRIPANGVYELWYSGTPPGPRDEIYPSFASPFQITLDSGKPISVYRETVTVVENYTPAYYWNIVGDVNLSAGFHRIRFEVTEKRRVDGRYYFYLDCFFLVKKENGRRVLAGPLPDVFPKNPDSKAINSPFLSIEDYLIKIRDDPESIQPYVYLSLVYTLLGDYLNALKYLNRAAALQPESLEVLLLIAKNRIWKGDVTEGLARYRELLSRDPKRLDLWMEAGKVAGWMGRYDESASFFTGGLSSYPKDLGLTVNLGLTYLWAGRSNDAERTLREAQSIAGSDSGLLKELGRVYRVNGYPERAAAEFDMAIRASPQDLEAYLLLIDAYLALGKSSESQRVEKLISDTFFPSPRLAAYLDSFKAKEGMKDLVIAEYRKNLSDNPDNLPLRQLLAQTYLWNGMKKEAIGEYSHILSNHAHLALKSMEARSTALLQTIDESHIALDFLGRTPASLRAAEADIAGRLSRYTAAVSARESARKTPEKLDAAEAALARESAALTDRIREARALTDRIQAVLDIAAGHSGIVSGLEEGEKKEEQAFIELTKGNHWKWDKPAVQAEFKSQSAGDPLARLVLAKIYLADGQTTAAHALLGAPAEGSDPGSSFAGIQALLWGGRAQEALPLIAELASAPAAGGLPAYLPGLARLSGHLSAGATASMPAPADPAADAAEALRELAGLERSVSDAASTVRKDLDLLHGIYSQAVTRAFYAFEEATYGIRNILGDFYVAEQKPDQAIAQFRKVLAVDPGNLDALLRLGKIYQWNRDWKSALDSFRGVYDSDPYFENVASLFNQLSREHADTIATGANYFSDTTRSQLHGETVFTHLFDSVWGLSAAYRGDDWAINRVVGSFVDNSAYRLHDVSIGLPMDLYPMGLKLTPRAGVTGVFTDAFDLFSASPYGQLDASLAAGSALFLSSTLRWGRYPETFDPLRTPINDASAEANISVSLSFIDVYPLRDTTLRTYGKLDYLTGAGLAFDNTIWTAAEEITVHILKGGNPYSLLTLILNATYQDSARSEPVMYYSPLQELTAGASLMGSTWIGVGGGSVLGLSLRGYAGIYDQQVFNPAPERFFWKFEGELAASLTLGDSTYSLGAFYNSTVPDSYWSLVVRLGYLVKLPQILTP